MALYCVFVGASASMVRAGSMDILLVIGPAFGRRSMVLNALPVSALVMAVQSPLALCDAGFQLSLIVMATPLTTADQQRLVRRVPRVTLRTAVLRFTHMPCDQPLARRAAGALRVRVVR